MELACAGLQWDYVFDWTVLKYQQAQITRPPLDTTQVQAGVATAAGIPPPRRVTNEDANQTIRSTEGSKNPTRRSFPPLPSSRCRVRICLFSKKNRWESSRAFGICLSKRYQEKSSVPLPFRMGGLIWEYLFWAVQMRFVPKGAIIDTLPTTVSKYAHAKQHSPDSESAWHSQSAFSKIAEFCINCTIQHVYCHTTLNRGRIEFNIEHPEHFIRTLSGIQNRKTKYACHNQQTRKGKGILQFLPKHPGLISRET